MPQKIHVDLDQFRLLAADPLLSRQAFADKLGVSKSWIEVTMRKLGLVPAQPRKRPYMKSKVRKDIPESAVRDLLEVQKLTQEQARAVLGCGQNCLVRLIRKYGIQTQRTGPRSGAGHYHSWKGGRSIDKDGYVLIYKPEHPNARSGTYVPEHRLVMEAHLGRYLTETEVVHHKDGNPANNLLENLQLFASNADHLRHELTDKTWGGSARPGTLKRRRQLPNHVDTSSQSKSENGASPSQSDSPAT